jgi:hypothetical protein
MSYTNIFGGYNINTAFPSYMSYILDSNLQLNWASSFIDTSPGVNNVTAQINDLNATVDGIIVTLADATLISVGQTIQFNNVGANTITINNFSGGELVVIPTFDNNQFVLYLQDNSTQAGTWGITHLGAGTSSADASILAGLGTVALNSQINTNFPGKTIGANYQVLLSDRASILVWTGGTGTITLPNQLAGFYIAVNNEGSGVVTIATPDATTIDGQVSFALNPSESSYFIGVNANWNTLGFGVESFFQVNVLSPIDLAPVNPSITLTNSQSSRLVQQYTGNLSNNVTVYYPAAAGQWYIWNNTTGPYTVTAQLAGPTGNPVNIPQGEKLILYSDGNSIYNTPTISTSAVFPDGSVGAPGITFASDTTTGFYKPPTPPAGVVNYSGSGTATLSFGSEAADYNLAILGGGPGVYYNAANTHYVGFNAGNVTTDTLWTLPLADATVSGQILYSNAAEDLSFTTAAYPTSTTINQILYSSANNTISGLATADNGVLVTSAGGVPSISSTLPADLTLITPTLDSPILITPELGVATATSLEIGPNGLLDSNGNELLSNVAAAASVNYWQITNAAAGNKPVLQVIGSDFNIIGQLRGQGNGNIEIQGTTASNNATAGYVGEFISSVITVPTNITTSATAQNLTSILLTAGDWDIEGNIFFTPTTTFTQIFAWGSSISATLPLSYNRNGFNLPLIGASGISIPKLRINASIPVTVYLSGFATFASGTATFTGAIYARRVR